jgi:hypothetical protein
MIEYPRVEVIFIQCLEASPQALLAFNVSVEKSAVILMGLPLNVICFFCLTAFNILSRVSVLVVLMIICHGVVLFWSGLFGVLEAYCICMEIDFSRFGKFCYYFVEYIMHSLCLHLLSSFNAHDSQVWCFDGVNEFLHFLSQVLSCLTNSSLVFPLITISSSNSEILSFVYSILLDWPSWFLRLTWSGDAMHGLGCGGVKVLPLLGDFSCKVYLQCLSKILL